MAELKLASQISVETLENKVGNLEKMLKYVIYNSDLKESNDKNSHKYKYECNCNEKTEFIKCITCWHDNHNVKDKCTTLVPHVLEQCLCEKYKSESNSICENCSHSKNYHEEIKIETYVETSKCGCTEDFQNQPEAVASWSGEIADNNINVIVKELNSRCEQCLHWGYDHTTFDNELPITKCSVEVTRSGSRNIGTHQIPCREMIDNILRKETPWLVLNAKKPIEDKTITFVS